MILKFVLWALSLCVLNAKTFKNPIVSAGADPWVIRHGGFYYYCRSGGGGIEVLKARKLQDIGHGERKVVFVPPVNKPYSKEIWAPELHHIHGKWYIYFAADDGNNANHRMYVLESSSPQGRYVLRGKIAARTDRWAIDGTVLHLKAGLFFVWSGWEGLRNYRQDLYIAKMSNPWTIVGERVLISRPTRQWERRAHPHVPGGINEGPQAFVSRGGVYIIYSASGSWSDDYCLGWIKCTNPAAVMDPKCWHKHGPVFSKVHEAYGPGHASFTKSPDNKEHWMVYHASLRSGGGWAGRSVRMQRFGVTRDGTPVFGRPAKCHIPLPEPSGS